MSLFTAVVLVSAGRLLMVTVSVLGKIPHLMDHLNLFDACDVLLSHSVFFFLKAAITCFLHLETKIQHYCQAGPDFSVDHL